MIKHTLQSWTAFRVSRRFIKICGLLKSDKIWQEGMWAVGWEGWDMTVVGKKSRGVWALHVWTERVSSKKEGDINCTVKCYHCQFPHACDWKAARPVLIWQWCGREEERRTGKGRGLANAYPGKTNILITVLDSPMGTICPSNLHGPFTALSGGCYLLDLCQHSFLSQHLSPWFFIFFKPEWLHFSSKPDFYRCQ